MPWLPVRFDGTHHRTPPAAFGRGVDGPAATSASGYSVGMELADTVRAIVDDVAPLVGTGKVADYIPALACVPAERFGIAVRTVEGHCLVGGDADERFSIQSVSKILTLTLALESRGDELWRRVGKEPSGDPFNSLFQLEFERGIPRNPLINAGAIVVADCLVSDRDAPKADIRAFASRLAGTAVAFDDEVAASERETGFRNASLAQLMKSFGNLENGAEAVLDTYFHQCSLAMSCRELATAFAYLADGGAQAGPCETGGGEAGEGETGGGGGGAGGEATRVVSAERARRINALMLTCGTYDRAGEFAFEVGLPAKSGVGGGIVAVVPGRGTLAVWSPGLGPSGNSVAGVEALRRFVARTGWSVF